MEKIIYFDWQLNADFYPFFYVGRKTRYLYYNSFSKLIHHTYSYKNFVENYWAGPIDYAQASKIVNTLHKTNYNITYCPYAFSKGKLFIAPFALNHESMEKTYKYDPSKYPTWFTKE